MSISTQEVTLNRVPNSISPFCPFAIPPDAVIAAQKSEGKYTTSHPTILYGLPNITINTSLVMQRYLGLEELFGFPPFNHSVIGYIIPDWFCADTYLSPFLSTLTRNQ